MTELQYLIPSPEQPERQTPAQRPFEHVSAAASSSSSAIAAAPDEVVNSRHNPADNAEPVDIRTGI